MRRHLWRPALATLCLAMAPTVAWADVTAFLGASPTSAARLARGAAVGAGLVVVAFEVEAAQFAERTGEGAPGLSTGMANVLVQTPIAVSGMQFYGTAGVGVYRERLASRQETSVAGNVGGGIKIKVTGPLRLRLDYRLFRLRGAPVNAVYHRLYAGANLGF
ncbi:MAG TPA: hypothetical protein VMW48_10345 [Vicinamibacterales bacterium]|nr:hypothetical protein [Vicinamibacterales bacterium]